MTLNSIISRIRIKFSKKVILEDSDKPNIIVQMNRLHSVTVTEIFDVMYAIYSRVYISKHYGKNLIFKKNQRKFKRFCTILKIKLKKTKEN